MNVKEQLWKGFIANEQVDLSLLPQDVAKSWQQCRVLNVDPYAKKSEAVLTPQQLRKEQRAQKLLIDLVKQQLSIYLRAFSIQQAVFILTDANGYILWRDGHEQTTRLANQMAFSEGHRWHEQDVGTNAISVALQTGKMTTLTGYDHYAVGSHKWSCTAVVIYDAHENVCGVLDVSSYLNDSATTKDIQIFLQLIATNISEKLKNHYLTEQRQLVEYVVKEMRAGVVTDADNFIVKVSDKLLIDEAQWVGQPIDAFLRDYDKQAVQQPIVIDDQVIGYFYPIIEKETPVKQFYYEGIETKNARYAEFMQHVERVANSHVPVHIFGESGSGKEVIARTLHQNSPFANGPLVAINCGAISESLLESELFGYAPGAFTGANAKGYKGKIAEAHGGTLFLDEVDSMSERMQAALLRVLENYEVTRIGSTKAEQVSFRLVTASNKDLRAEVAADKFRMDLFYRIYVCPLSIPPLRERKEDIYMLMKRFCEQHDWYPHWMMKAYNVATTYDWYGNVRELNNFLARLHVYYAQVEPTETDIAQLIEMGTIVPQKRQVQQNVAPLNEEARHLKEVLERHHYHISKAAEALGMARSTLYRKMKRYNLK